VPNARAAGQSLSGRRGVMSCNLPGPGSELRAFGVDQLAEYRMASAFPRGRAMLDSTPSAAFFVSHRQQSSISYAVTGQTVISSGPWPSRR
jgi:hypothetical protein